NQLMITIGILSSYLINYAFTPIEGWRWMLGLAVLPSLILLIGVAFMPESPRWLLEHKSEKAARDVMKLTFKESEIDKEIADMKEINAISESTWKVLKSPWLRPTLIIGSVFALLQQIIGINAIIYYAPTIFSKAGLGNAISILGTVGIVTVNVLITILAIFVFDNVFSLLKQIIGIYVIIYYAPIFFSKAGLGNATSILGTVGIGTVNVLITIVAIMIIDKIDRKRLLVIGNIGMVASLLIMAILVWTVGIQSSACIMVACLTLFIIFFGFTWGPVLWVMLPELFPMRARGAATGIAALVLSIGSL